MTAHKPIIRLFFAKMKQAYIDMPEEEKRAFMRKDRENIDALGMKAVAMVDCHWSNEEWDYIGIEEWPSIEVVEMREKFEKEELKISKYVESRTYLGTPESFEAYGKE